MKMLLRGLRWSLAVAAVLLLALLTLRAWHLESGPPLSPWHTHVPPEPGAKALDDMEWADYLAAEDTLFDDVAANVTAELAPAERVAANRYHAGSPMYPPALPTDWNRSFVMAPAGDPVGAVVLLHGLTDTPYSLRHVGAYYRDHGFVALGIRLPAHGTVPAALTQVDWQDWRAATRLAMREARRRVGPGRPLHLVGYSNGGALAMNHALAALEDPGLETPGRVVLISPMIGVTRFAEFAGVLGWPALLPRFAKSAWLSIIPEFNPFKYNSFPVNAARQAAQLTRELQRQVVRAERAGRLADLPPVLTFQSVVDATVSTDAVVSALYARLPTNGSELVFFDLNRNARLGPMLRPSFEGRVERLLPPAPRNFRFTLVTNERPDSPLEVERDTPAGETLERVRPLAEAYPPGVFSLSHIALPFPVDDPLYGLQAQEPERYGINLGMASARGEMGALIVTLDSLTRLTSNPFFGYQLERIGASLATQDR